MVDLEKITVNLTPVDLGRIDVLVSQGVYSGRADFIRDAVRRGLDQQTDLIDDAITRERSMTGLHWVTKADLFERKANGERLRLDVVGLLKFGDVDPDLADEVIEHVRIRGVLKGPAEVLKRLEPKIEREGRKR